MRKKNNIRHQPPEKKIVMAFGTFDFFHDGHAYFLNQAKSFGDYLIVVIARDRTVHQIKGEAPANSQRRRAKTVYEKSVADKVIIGYHKDKHKVIRKFRPNVIALGYDQYVFTQKLGKTLIDLNLDTEIRRVEAHFPQVYKSSLLRKTQMEAQTQTQGINPEKKIPELKI